MQRSDRRLAAWLGGFVLFALLLPSAGIAQNYSRIELMQASTGLGDGQPLLLGIRIEPRPGWKTYWRAPGESGLPPVFTFRVHDNMDVPEIKWPAPKRLMLQGLESYGYDGPVIFPFHVQPRDTTRPIQIEVQVDYAVCMDICVPEQAVLKLSLQPGPYGATAQGDALLAALARVPVQQTEDSFVHIETVITGRNDKQVFLQVQASSASGFKKPDLFADGAAELLFGAPDIDYSSGRRQAVLRLLLVQLDPGQPINGQTITLTLVDGDFAIEKQVKLADPVRTE